MKKDIEDDILSLGKIRYLSNMAVERLQTYDKYNFTDHYDEIVSIFSFLDEQLTEKYERLYNTYYCDDF